MRPILLKLDAIRSATATAAPGRCTALETQGVSRPVSMGCFARNSALRAALDPATDDLLLDIVINRCGALAHRRRQPRTRCAPLTPSPVVAAGARLSRLRFDVTDGVTLARR